MSAGYGNKGRLPVLWPINFRANYSPPPTPSTNPAPEQPATAACRGELLRATFHRYLPRFVYSLINSWFIALISWWLIHCRPDTALICLQFLSRPARHRVITIWNKWARITFIRWALSMVLFIIHEQWAGRDDFYLRVFIKTSQRKK